MPDTRNADPEIRSTNVPDGFEDVTLGADYTFVAKVRGVYVGTAGTVIASVDGTNYHTFKGCAAGSILLGGFKKVRSTGNGTTAADLVGVI
jgi:hypothetical protein